MYSKGTKLEIGEEKAFFIKNMRAGQVYVDVGAYDGDTITTPFFLNRCPGLRIVGIEPVKELCDQMRQKFKDNKQITIINKACWQEKGNIIFHEYSNPYKGLSAIKEIMTQLRPWPQIVQYAVEADTLDNILASLGIDEVDYLKVDTEGSEEEVLLGFTRYHPGTQFSIEFHIFNLANILQRLLEMSAKIDVVIMSRAPHVFSHVVGHVRGEFTTKSNIFEKAEYWYGELGYRPPGYSDFPIHQVKVNYILSKEPKGKVLDIGCAFGYIVKRLRDKGIDALGIDISQYALSQAPEDVKPYLKHGPADNLPWPNEYFDMVVTFGTLEHLDSEILPKAISEIKRVASRGIIAVTPGDNPYFDGDITHQTKQPLSWWRKQFPPEFEVRSDANEEWLTTIAMARALAKED